MNTEKSYEVDKSITKIFGIDRQKSIKSNKCVWCNQPDLNFRDEKSLKEYTISGLCQACQDQILGK